MHSGGSGPSGTPETDAAFLAASLEDNADIIAERDARLARLQRSSMLLATSFHALVASAPLTATRAATHSYRSSGDEDADSMTDVAIASHGTKVAAASSSLVSAVEALSALIQEVRRETLIQKLTGEGERITWTAAAADSSDRMDEMSDAPPRH